MKLKCRFTAFYNLQVLSAEWVKLQSSMLRDLIIGSGKQQNAYLCLKTLNLTLFKSKRL
jgi:hypothetical protein